MTPEQEGARGDCGYCGAPEGYPPAGPCPEHPAPTGPRSKIQSSPAASIYRSETGHGGYDPPGNFSRSISEEQLERLRDAVKDEFYVDYIDPTLLTALTALLADREHWQAAYEQAEAERARFEAEATILGGDLNDARHERGQAEAERDTAQASEARLRGALERIVKADRTPEHRPAFYKDDVATPTPREIARAALASTPNPEERCCPTPERCDRLGVCENYPPDPEELGEWIIRAEETPGGYRNVVIGDPLPEGVEVRVREVPAPDPTPEPEEGR